MEEGHLAPAWSAFWVWCACATMVSISWLHTCSFTDGDAIP